MDYQASPFSGEWNEDPVAFLGWFRQCTGSADDKTRAKHFMYYLQAGSDADEWFEDLPDEEKGSWVIVERLFCKRWLNEEISTKESVTGENEHQPASTHPNTTFPTSYSFTGTQTEIGTLQQPDIGPPICVATSQVLEISGNSKNSKTHSTSEKSPEIIVLSSTTPSVTSTDLVASSTSVPALETHEKTAGFTPEVEKTEISPISTESTHILPSQSLLAHTDDSTRVYASPQTLNDTILHLPTLPTTASSSPTPYSFGHNKGVLLGDFFESQPQTAILESTESPTVITALETSPKTADFAQKHRKATTTENLQKFTVLSSTTLSYTVLNSSAPSIIPTALETRSKKTVFTQKREKVEKSDVFTQTNTLATPTLDDTALPTPSVHNPIVSAFKTLSTTALFGENHQKSASSNHFQPKSSISELFNWKNNAGSLATPFILPTKHPCKPLSLYSFR